MDKKLTNCRNCKFAEWTKSRNGRRLFGNFARCTFEVQVPVMPASITESYNGGTIVAILTAPRAVAERDNVPLDCATWAPEAVAAG